MNHLPSPRGKVNLSMTYLLELNSKGHKLVTSRNSGSRVKPVNSLTTSNNVEATTWKRQRGSDNLEATTWKRQLGSDNLEATTWKRQRGSDNLEATTWKRQLGSDNLEATTWKGGGGGGNKNENTKIQNCDSTPSKPSNALSESHNTVPPPLFLTWKRQLGSDKVEATKWKRQRGSDNLEATACDPYRLPYEWYSRECERCFYFCEEAL